MLVERLLNQEGFHNDSEALIHQRLHIYQEQTAPLIAFYQRRQCLIEIDSSLSIKAIDDTLENALIPKAIC